MRPYFLTILILLVPVLQSASAQSIPRSTSQAEAEGAAFAHANGASQPNFMTRAVAGTNERKCIAPAVGDSLQAGALRSGNFIVRGSLAGEFGPHAGRARKFLWIPLHSVEAAPTPLVIRAAAATSPDTVRATFPGPVHSHGQYGYPSTLEFPSPGRWIVVATSGDDWGCFLLDVAR
jgi:hypothetical protein